ncbi:MAG: hypothetical protein QOJ89_1591 [bacterium]
MDPEELAGSIQRLVEWAERHAPQPEPAVRVRLREHFGCDPAELPVVSRPLEPWDRPNLQVAIDAWLGDKLFELMGIPQMEGYRAGLAELVRGGPWSADVELGGVEHVTVPLGDEDSIICVQAGLWLVRDGDRRAVVMLSSTDHMMGGGGLSLEVMAAERHASRSCSPPACSKRSSVRRSATHATRSAYGRAGATCVAGCCCMARRASARR